MAGFVIIKYFYLPPICTPLFIMETQQRFPWIPCRKSWWTRSCPYSPLHLSWWSHRNLWRAPCCSRWRCPQGSCSPWTETHARAGFLAEILSCGGSMLWTVCFLWIVSHGRDPQWNSWRAADLKLKVKPCSLWGQQPMESYGEFNPGCPPGAHQAALSLPTLGMTEQEGEMKMAHRQDKETAHQLPS